ncbi:TadE/TadG family type IV pilus assembly protein [Marinobacter sp. SS21]|uniref:TadE/TadG family type IV pilus assembly protein n=1 Tax=Marinobacter sp. SS21 TaxID=2979460 RepID=UPI00232CAD68|nr:TadE/TadG family type IV pilus assembly protein [Marinobacter sp. SS21]MDC0663760.1 TadE/TadG family type IV pilus assembly protein [Marinobacter sp. SS21]
MRMKSLRHQQGTEVVEFAITASLLFLILFGIIETSVVLFDKATLTNASREGSRTGILWRPDPRNLATEDNEITQAIDDYASDYLISLGGAASMSTDVQRVDVDGDGTFNSGDQVVVTITYPYQFLLLPEFLDTSFGNFELSATTVMRAE